ncbi:MAG TPA: hypothetical protein VGR51_07485 [Thermoplasmata archaeon]|jgi:hypothetical protein|nr:hypothetical protein [Thermoplasmata archaeon]
MQGHQTWTSNFLRSINRNQFTTLFVLLVFLLIGAGLGYFVAAGAVHQATLNVQVLNDTGTSQDIRITLNNDQSAVVNVPDGQTVSVPLRVGWTSTATGMYEVRATPVSDGASDAKTVTVGNGQTLLVALRVR